MRAELRPPVEDARFAENAELNVGAHEERIVRFAVAGGEAERDGDMEVGKDFAADHIGDRLEFAAPFRAEIAGSVGREIGPFAKDDSRSSVENAKML